MAPSFKPLTYKKTGRRKCQIRVGGQGPGVLLHAKFINRAVFPDGRWLQPGEQVDWDQNNNRWRADNEFLDT